MKAVNHFRRRYGKLIPSKRRKVRKVLFRFLTELKPLLVPAVKVVQRALPRERMSPCATCALNPKTRRMKGFVGTTFGLMKSLREVKPFICHRNQPGWRKNIIDPCKVELCTGFYALLIVKKREVRKLAGATLRELDEIALPRA